MSATPPVGHVDEDALVDMARGRPPTLEERRHLAGCRRCARELAVAGLVADAAGAGAGCPEAEAAVRMSDGLGTAEELASWRRHLRGCGTCAAEHAGLRRAASLTSDPSVAPGEWALERAGLLESLRALVRFELPPAPALATRAGGARGDASAEGLRHLARGSQELAQESLLAARRAGELAPEISHQLGCLLVWDGRLEEGIVELQAAATRAPRRADHAWSLAQALLLAGRAEDGLRELRRVVRLPGARRAAARRLIRDVESLLSQDGR